MLPFGEALVPSIKESVMCLTDEEMQFLAKHGLSTSDIFDARGMSAADWKRGAKELGKNFVLGSRCGRAGHRLRTRAGHCIQCDTSKIAYISRQTKSGYVYIAGSIRKKLIKIGGTESIDDRERTLNNESYARAYDWEILSFVRVDKYGDTEGKILKLLAPYQIWVSYPKEGKLQESNETFQCSFTVAKNALDEVMKDDPPDEGEIYISPDIRFYEFS